MSAPPITHKPPRKVRFGLRKQTLLIVLCLGFLPSLLTLLVSTTYAIRAIRAYVVDQAQSLLVVQADRLGEYLHTEAEKLRALAKDEDLAAALLRREDEARPGMAFFRRRFETALGAESTQSIVVLFEGNPIGRLGADGYHHGAAHLPPEVLEPIRATIGHKLEDDLFAFEARNAERKGLVWAAAGMKSAEGLWLAMPLDVNLEELVTQLSRTLDEEVFLLSSVSGPIGSPSLTPEATELFQESASLFAGSTELLEVPGDANVYTSVRVGAMSLLSRQVPGQSALVLVRRVELDAPLVSLLYGFWQIALYGLIFIGLIGAFGLWLSNRLVNPIIRLRAGFLRLEQGDLDFRIDLRTGDEMEELAASMNQMASTLQETYQNLAWKLLELDEKAKQLTISSDIAQAINRSLDLDALFKEIISSIRLLVPADALIVCTVPEGRDHIDVAFVYPRSLLAQLPQGTSIPLSSSFSKICIDEERVAIFPLAEDGEKSEEVVLRGGVLTTLCVLPLRTQTGPVGVLLLADQDAEAFRPQEIDILKLVSSSLATALEHSRLYEHQAQFASELERQVLERTKALQRVQEQLIQAEKLATTGELAAKVAHEINNPLSIIKNYLKLLQGALIREKPQREDLETARSGLGIIEEEIDRIARIVHKLRRASSPAGITIANIDMNSEIAILVQLFQETFHGKTLHLETNLDPYLQTVRLSRDSLRQILMNLLRNAYDATQAGGRILIETVAHEPSEANFCIKVKDTGSGIPQENLERIFDPFFTTKKEGKGTGLGLSVSYGLARTMGGRLEVRSTFGQGAEFVLILPMEGPKDDSDSSTAVIRRDGDRIIIG